MNRLRLARDDLDMSRQEAIVLLRMRGHRLSEKTLYNWEARRTKPRKRDRPILRALARIYRCKMEDLGF